MNEILVEALSYAKAMWRYRWLSILVAWGVSVVGWAFVIMLPDKFESQARIYVDTGSLLAPLLKGIAVETDIDKEVLIMERTLLSRPNLEQVMRMNDLDLTTTAPNEVEALLEQLARDITVTAQTKNLFSISYSHTSPRQAQSVVQSVLTIFVENNLGQSRTDMEAARGFIEKQIAEYERQLQQAEQRLAEFKVKNGQFLINGSYAAKLEAGLTELRTAQIALQDAETRRNELARQLQTIPEHIPASDALQILAGRQGANTLEGRIAMAEQNLDNLKLQYTEKHPDVVSLQRLITALKAQKDKEGVSGAGTSSASNPLYENIKMMLIETETNIATLQRRVTEAELIVEKDRQMAQTAPRIEAELADLDRDYAVLKGNYEELLARRESARISQAQEASTSAVQFRVIDPPQLPVSATSPSRPMLYLLSLVAGIGAGGGIAFLLATLNDCFVSSSQLGRAFGLPVLGRVSLLLSAAEEMKIRRDYWKFGLAGGGLVASFLVVLSLGPSLVSVAARLNNGSLSSLFGGAV